MAAPDLTQVVHGIGLPELLGAVMLGALGIYAVTAGADFGGGVWALFASGPHKAQQQRAIEAALAPVWEANHVWLIFVVVVLFSAFPAAFAAICILLYVPLSLVLLGIVMRGAGFVFRQYGYGGNVARVRWGRVFSAASVITPFFLGASLAALCGGLASVTPAGEALGTTNAWLGRFALLCGAFVTVLFSFLAAVYLAVEAEGSNLKDDFRKRALGAGILLGVLSVAVRLEARFTSPAFASALLGAWWSNAVQAVVAALAIGALASLYFRRFRLARLFAVAQTVGIVFGFGLAQYPNLVAPGLTLRQAAAPDAALAWILGTVVAGTVFLVPCLLWLLRIFKHQRHDHDHDGAKT